MLVESQQGMIDHAEKASSAASARSKQAVRHLETVSRSIFLLFSFIVLIFI